MPGAVVSSLRVAAHANSRSLGIRCAATLADALVPVPGTARRSGSGMPTDGKADDVWTRIDLLDAGRANWELSAARCAQQIVRADAIVSVGAEGARRMGCRLAFPAPVKPLREPWLNGRRTAGRCLEGIQIVNGLGPGAAAGQCGQSKNTKEPPMPTLHARLRSAALPHRSVLRCGPLFGYGSE